MIQKRNKFWTIVFSIFPGAGHMFMGFMQRGLSLMVIFFAIAAFATITGFEAVLFFIPLLVCYSFFSCISYLGCSDEEFAGIEDKALFSMDKLLLLEGFKGKKYSRWVGIGLILLGLYLFLDMGLSFLSWSEDWFWLYDTLRERIPQGVFNIILIAVGFKLIKGKKKPKEEIGEEAGQWQGEE